MLLETRVEKYVRFYIFPGAVFAVSIRANADEFDSAGVKIYYETHGTGEPVVLIHGYLSSAAINWDMPGTTAELAKKYRVIELDCRGHGRSGKPEGESEYGVKMVDDVVRLMDHLNVASAHVVATRWAESLR